jgi:hypothetical protein
MICGGMLDSLLDFFSWQVSGGQNYMIILVAEASKNFFLMNQASKNLNFNT